MDDNKSDNTDDLLTGIEPLLCQTEAILSEKDYQKEFSTWPHQSYSRLPSQVVIIDDILSARSNFTNQSVNQSFGTSFKRTPVGLSQTNVAIHNSVRPDDSVVDSDRTTSSQFYEASASCQSTPRNTGSNKHRQIELSAFSTHIHQLGSIRVDSITGESRRDLDQSHRDSGPDNRAEIQRIQLTNKQLSTQLQEAKLTIQTLSVQLEQVQIECQHKEKTLENLDNTLGRLVAGWKKRDGQKDMEIDNLNQQIDAKDNAICESQRIADESRIALTNAMTALGTEKMKVEQIQKNLNQEIESLKKGRNQMIADNKELAKRIVHLESELKKTKDMCFQKGNSLESIKQQAAGEKQFLEKEIGHLKNDIEKLKEEGINQQLEIKFREEKIDQTRNEMKLFEEEIYKSRKELMEKDSNLNEMRAKIRGMSDEHTAAIRKLEKEFQNRLQHELNSSITSLNEQHKKTLQSHSSNFQIKLNEQSKRHRLELERLRQVAEQEIASRLADSQETISMLRARLERSEKSVQFWQQEKESVEKARNQISARLYDVMSLSYRSNDQDTHKYPASAANQSHQIAIPKVVNPSSYLLNLAQIPTSSISNNHFEPIKTDYLSSTVTTPVCFSKSGQYSVISDAQIGSQKNLALTSSINTALSY